MTIINSKKVFFIGIIASITTLSGCSHPRAVSPHYSLHFIPGNRITSQKEQKEKQKTSEPEIKATFGIGNTPAVVKAYQEFIKKGIAQEVRSDSLRTIAYDPYDHPMMACSPLHLCILQLEQGEQINDVELGDALHWSWSKSLVGTQANGSYQISLRPKLKDIATDVIITTDKRTYNVGLVSQEGLSSHIINFYYPEESRQALLKQQNKKEEIQRSVISSDTVIDLKHLNFNYQIGGNHPVWQPRTVFDDGTKTFITMEPIIDRVDLPVLYIQQKGELQLVNYRYRRPYFIVDGLFQHALLISGKGKDQARVIIINRQFR